MTDREKRKLFFKRWIQAILSPFYRRKNGILLENGVYDADDKNMRNIYFVLRMLNTGYLMFMCVLVGDAIHAEGIPSDINFRPRILQTILIPGYAVLYWIKYTFFLTAFAIDENEKFARAEVRYNVEVKQILKVLFVALILGIAFDWLIVLI